MDSYSELKIAVEAHVAVLTMDSPPVNALTRVLNDELTHALDRISASDEIRVVVLTGAGRQFCAGADLKGRAEIIEGPGPGGAFAPHARVLPRVCRQIRSRHRRSPEWIDSYLNRLQSRGGAVAGNAAWNRAHDERGAERGLPVRGRAACTATASRCARGLSGPGLCASDSANAAERFCRCCSRRKHDMFEHFPSSCPWIVDGQQRIGR